MANTKISNCGTYENELKCARCIEGYYILNETKNITLGEENFTIQNQCLVSEIDNCLEENNNNGNPTCNVCDPLFKRVRNGDSSNVFTCQNIEDDSCVLYNDSQCVTCDSASYLDVDGTCKEAATISSCEVFSSKNTCSKCAPNFTLN